VLKVTATDPFFARPAIGYCIIKRAEAYFSHEDEYCLLASGEAGTTALQQLHLYLRVRLPAQYGQVLTFNFCQSCQVVNSCVLSLRREGRQDRWELEHQHLVVTSRKLPQALRLQQVMQQLAEARLRLAAMQDCELEGCCCQL